MGWLTRTKNFDPLRELVAQNEADLQWVGDAAGRVSAAVARWKAAEAALEADPSDATLDEFMAALTAKRAIDPVAAEAIRLARPGVVRRIVDRSVKPLTAAWREIERQVRTRLDAELKAEGVRNAELDLPDPVESPAVTGYRKQLRRAECALQRLGDMGALPPEQQLAFFASSCNEACGLLVPE